MEAVDKLNKIGLTAKFHLLDVTNSHSIKQLKKYLQSTYGGLDILVNNAGIMYIVRIVVFKSTVIVSRERCTHYLTYA